jgi:hypothetical protein
MEAALPASPTTSKTGLTSSGGGVLLVAPKTSGEAGNNATLGKFAAGYTGLTLTNTHLQYPSTKVPAYSNGQKCGAGTPDAGKVGVVLARSWVVSTTTGKNHEEVETGGATTEQAADLKFADRQLITVGFAPKGTTLPKPPASTITGLLQVLSGNQAPVATTSTTVAGVTSSTVQSATTTAPLSSTTTSTVPATTTTAAPATTTTKPSSTTTTK